MSQWVRGAPEEGDFFVGQTTRGTWRAGCVIEGQQYTSEDFATEAEAEAECTRAARDFDRLLEEKTISVVRSSATRARGFETLANACIRGNDLSEAINCRNAADEMWSAAIAGALAFLLSDEAD